MLSSDVPPHLPMIGFPNWWIMDELVPHFQLLFCRRTLGHIGLDHWEPFRLLTTNELTLMVPTIWGIVGVTCSRVLLDLIPLVTTTVAVTVVGICLIILIRFLTHYTILSSSLCTFTFIELDSLPPIPTTVALFTDIGVELVLY